ncbi:MAG: DUF1186 domain-containing protein [Anaerolineae bacterium]|nr:DUF1186 domain-containing protein [Anaerolineae bacterium]
MVKYNSAYAAPPLAQLLKLGDPWDIPFDSPRYEQMGFTQEHIPTLIQLATDDTLLWEWDEKNPNPYLAPIHAWRVLGKMRAEAAIEPLVALFNMDEENEPILEDLPDVVTQFGEAAIPALESLLQRPDGYMWGLSAAADVLADIAQAHSAARSRSVEIITARLRNFRQNEPELNGTLIGDLCDLKAVESAEVIKAAFYAKAVDLHFLGNWFDVKPKLGLDPDAFVPGPEPDNDPIPPLIPGFPPALDTFEPPPTPMGELPYSPQLFNRLSSLIGNKSDLAEDDFEEDEEEAPFLHALRAPQQADKKKKAKRKQAKQSRKQNRKKKK